jgi:asparagine synthase (glutamine-hydrolysing)
MICLKPPFRQQLISDVPLGVFLSGGTDSTIVTGLAKETKADIHTYTVVFDDPQLQSYNEQRIARITSNHLHTTHNELVVSSPNPLEMLNLVEFFDQPFGNPTSYLMWLISKYAREHIVVALCGAGGDELYVGYPRYLAAKLARLLSHIPYELFRPIQYLADHLSDKYKTPRIRRIKKFLHGLDKNFTHQFMKWIYFMDEPQKQMLLANHDNSIAPSVRILDKTLDGTFSDFNNLLLMDTQTFLPNNLLEYTDKMAMATALEVRVPFLDHNFIEFSLNVPFHLKLRGTKTKWLLAQLSQLGDETVIF